MSATDPPKTLKAKMTKQARSGLFSSWKERYFILEEGILSYYEKVKKYLLESSLTLIHAHLSTYLHLTFVWDIFNQTVTHFFSVWYVICAGGVWEPRALQEGRDGTERSVCECNRQVCIRTYILTFSRTYLHINKHSHTHAYRSISIPFIFI